MTRDELVVDGVPSGNPLAAQWDLRQIPLEGIAHVAFYPGPQAAAWGGDGTGGVLAITTRRAVAIASRAKRRSSLSMTARTWAPRL